MTQWFIEKNSTKITNMDFQKILKECNSEKEVQKYVNLLVNYFIRIYI
jgi:hypothetical protein